MIESSKRPSSGWWALALLVITALPVQLPAQDPVPELSFEQVLARPDLWPVKCRMVADFRDGKVKLKKGKKVALLNVRDGQLRVLLSGKKEGTGIDPQATDFLKLANEAYAALDPEHRDFGMKELSMRAELWPKQGVLLRPLALYSGEKKWVLKVGTKIELGTISGNKALVWGKAIGFPLWIGAQYLDLMDHAHKVMAGKSPEAEPGRMLRQFDGKLIDFGDGGRRVKLDQDNLPKYLMLYYSAGWCGPCHQFSPRLVDFYNQRPEAGKDFEVLFVSQDGSDSEMRSYAAEKQFPWLAISHDELKELPMLNAYSGKGIPHLMVIDAEGRVVINGTGETGSVIPKFAQMLDQAAAKGSD